MPDNSTQCDRKNFDSLLWALVTVFQVLPQQLLYKFTLHVLRPDVKFSNSSACLASLPIFYAHIETEIIERRFGFTVVHRIICFLSYFLSGLP